MGAGHVPAARQALGILSFLATRPGPVGAAVIAREVGLPRSTAYHLLAELVAADFVVHLPEEHAYGLGVAAFEVGSAYLRHDPLERLARPLLARLVEQAQQTVQLGILQGNETVYLLKEQPRAPLTLITDVGVRLPAHLTASGRAMLAHLPAAQVRALFPGAEAFTSRTGRGPRSLRELRELIRVERRRGWAEEDGFVTAGHASVAAAAFDHGGRPIAAVAVTFSDDVEPRRRERLGIAAVAAADALTVRISGRRPPGAAQVEAL
ncbi:MAG: helix-turn-helix domain-containing protein [Frankiales bacterium]|nr:helix-turn-helix domain-containing protein [Frankiales bacterium]